MKPYATGAPIYQMAGWSGILPLPVGKKASPPVGYTGRTGTDPDAGVVAEWATDVEGVGAGNIALRLPDGVLGIDVDDYGSRGGGASLAALERQYGALPATWRSSARGGTGGRGGILFFRVPEGLDWSEAAAGPGIDLIRRDHRYAVVWPSLHPGDEWTPAGEMYRWYGPDGESVEIGVPSIDQFPWLLDTWVERLGRRGGGIGADRGPDLQGDTSGHGVVSARGGGGVGGVRDEFGAPARAFTRAEAVEFCRPLMDELRAAPDGEINTRLVRAAMALGHFADVDGFWSGGEARSWLMAALAETVYDGRTWRAEATIAGALRDAAADWRAVAVVQPGGADGSVVVAGVEGTGADAAASGAGSADAVAALRAELLDSEALEALPAPVPLIRGWLWRDSVGSIIGKSGDGKSFVALDMAGAVGGGTRWHGADVDSPGEVWIIAAEGASGIRKRVRAWEAHHGRRMKGVKVLPRPVQASSPEWLTLIALAREDRPVLVFADTQARITVGMDENSNTEMGMFVARLEMLRAASGACVMAVHHIGHNGDHGRGASALKGAWTTELRVSKGEAAPEAGGGTGARWAVTVECTKSKDDAEPEPIVLDMAVVAVGEDEQGIAVTSVVLTRDPLVDAGIAAPLTVGRWAQLEAELPESRLAVVDVVRNVFPNVGGTKAEVRAECARAGMHVRTFRRCWDELLERGVLARVVGSQRYRLASAAAEAEDNSP